MVKVGGKFLSQSIRLLKGAREKIHIAHCSSLEELQTPSLEE